MGGPPTDLKNMADCQEWKGQRFKKIYLRKITQHEENLYFCIFAKNLPIAKKTDSASPSQEV